MDTPQRLTRRQVLAGMGILAFAAVPGVLRGRGAVAIDPQITTAAERVLALVDGDPAIAELGGAYLETRSDTPDPETLVAELLPSEMTYRDVEQVSVEELRTRMHDAVIADFAAERTVAVQGWQLSATEARIAGLLRTLRP